MEMILCRVCNSQNGPSPNHTPVPADMVVAYSGLNELVVCRAGMQDVVMETVIFDWQLGLGVWEHLEREGCG